MKLFDQAKLGIFGIALALVGCGGHGGPSDTLTQAQHDALAQKFITSASTAGVNYTLVKADTQQQGYIVVQDASGVYYAFYIDSWNPATTSAASLSASYTALAPTGNNTFQTFVQDGYEDYGYTCCDINGNSYYTDLGWVDTSYYLTFSVAQPSSKDLQKLAAFQQQYDIAASAKKIVSSFGVTLERATEVAKLAIQVKNTPKMSASDYDNLSQQLLGVPLAKLDSAIANGTAGSNVSADVNEIINSAAATNGVGPEQARALMNSFMSQGQ